MKVDIIFVQIAFFFVFCFIISGLNKRLLPLNYDKNEDFMRAFGSLLQLSFFVCGQKKKLFFYSDDVKEKKERSDNKNNH